MKQFSEVGQALEKAFEMMGKDAKVLLMPFGGSTLPVLKQEKKDSDAGEE